MHQLAQLIIIVAPSGTGKSSLIKKLCSALTQLHWSVSVTTRKPRIGEVDGKDYSFISEEQFLKDIAANKFVEWAKVHGNYYGTSRDFVEDGIRNKKTLLFDLDVQGADAVVHDYKKYVKTIFIAPPSLETLEERLRKRGSETEENIKIRLSNAAHELNRKNDYDYLILNDSFDHAYNDLHSIISGLLARGTK